LLVLFTIQALTHLTFLICSGFFVNHGKWKGISVGALLEKAKMETGVTHVTFSGPEDESENSKRFPIEDIFFNV
jgi:DMSO/TMAO reductase YedYZ molybdopterin-dependent catalytic subunit